MVIGNVPLRSHAMFDLALKGTVFCRKIAVSNSKFEILICPELGMEFIWLSQFD